jgi:hypothetical protein
LWKTIQQNIDGISQKTIIETLPVSKDSVLHADHFVNEEWTLQSDSLPHKEEKSSSLSIPEKSDQKNAISIPPTLISEVSEESNIAEIPKLQEKTPDSTVNQTIESKNPSESQENKTQITNTSSTFGENEFISYFKRNYDRSLCQGQTISFVVNFYVSPTGHPGNITITENNCAEMATEIKRLLLGSPIWSKTNRKVTLHINL